MMPVPVDAHLPRLGTIEDVNALEQIVTLAGRDPETAPEANELLQQIFRLASDRLKGDVQ